MQVIYKYVIEYAEVGTTHILNIHKDAWLLNVASINNGAYLYFMVDPTRAEEQRQFVMFGTGIPIDKHDPDRLLYVDTVVSKDEQFVGHVFEIYPEDA